MAWQLRGAAAQEAGGQRGDGERIGDEAPAAGQEGSSRLPMSLHDRPLTLPAGVLRYDVGVDVFHVSGASASVVGIHLGLGYGITDDLEVGGVLLPLQAFVGPAGSSGDVGFGDMSLYGQYRFVQGDVEVGARMDVLLPTHSRSDDLRPVWIGVGLPVLLRLGDRVRVDTGVQLAMHLNPEFEAALGPVGFPPFRTYPLPMRSASGGPFVLNVNANERIYLGLRTGLAIHDLRAAGDSVTMPLGFHVGGTGASARGPVADVTLRFEWPFFLTRMAPEDAVTTNPWQITFAASFYMDARRN
jgi:hypothetical protein